MPFRSEKQRRYLWKFRPDIADKWAHGEHSTSGKHGHRMPTRKKSRSHRRRSRR